MVFNQLLSGHITSRLFVNWYMYIDRGKSGRPVQTGTSGNAIFTWRWRSRSYYSTPGGGWGKKDKGSSRAANIAASREIYGGAAPPGAGVCPRNGGSRLPGSAMRARVGLHGEYWLPTGRTINRRSVDVARWEPAVHPLSALDPREPGTSAFAFPASISLIAEPKPGKPKAKSPRLLLCTKLLVTWISVAFYLSPRGDYSNSSEILTTKQ